MDDKDHVFSRFKDDKPEASDRRELLTIPRRAGATGSRVVEVVHVRSGGAVKDRPQRNDTHVRAASWATGFPAKQAVAAPTFVVPAIAAATVPTAHIMPAWEPSAEAASTAIADEAAVAPPRGRGRPRKHPTLEPAGAKDVTAGTEEQIPVSRRGPGRPSEAIAIASARRVANPFDAADDGANCMRCGYAIERAREKRGLLTCVGCG